ncbi:MAG: aspartate--tRNA(Asn) ligase [Candidatus Jordarchaeaceae archaeon]
MEDDAHNIHKTHFTSDIGPELDGKMVTLAGWVESIRKLGGIKFIILRDKEGRSQITVPRRKTEIFDIVDKLGKEYVVWVRGIVRKIEKAPQGAEIIPEEIKILNTAISPLPLDPSGKVDANLDTQLDNRVLDLRRPEKRAIFIIRHEAVNAIRQFLLSRKFIEINTPKIIAASSEGGADLFPISYYDKEAFLSQSAQLYKEQMSSVFEKVFEIAPCFRAEVSRTVRHLSELYAVDVEVAFNDYEDVMKLLEELVHHVFKHVKEKCPEELKALNYNLSVPETPFPRYTYTDIIEKLQKEGIEINWGEDISTQAYRKLGESLKGTYFIYDWPTAGKPFYILPRKDNPQICESFDLMYGWLELASGGTRIHKKDMLIERLKEQKLNPESFTFHLKTFDWGMPPHAGWGLGLERLVMSLTGAENIRECILYPRDRDRLTP